MSERRLIWVIFYRQTLSFCALMMSIIHAIVKGSVNLGKKKKKREGKNDQSDAMVS